MMGVAEPGMAREAVLTGLLSSRNLSFNRVLIRMRERPLFGFGRARGAQQVRQVGERSVSGRRSFVPVGILSRQPFGVQGAVMFVVVAVDAQQLPVAAVGRIVFEIMVFVMHRQFAQIFSGKITAAFAADPREDLQRLIAVV